MSVVRPLVQTEEPAKAGNCARDRRALQQLALNVHVKHSVQTSGKTTVYYMKDARARARVCVQMTHKIHLNMVCV